MTSAVDVCNNALANIGARASISSLTEDSPEARACNLQYLTVLGTLLRSAPWNFARKTITLSLLKALPGTPENTTTPTTTTWQTDYPPPGWLYAYAYPNDCMLMRYVLPQGYSGVSGVPIFSTGNSYVSTAGAVPTKFIVAADQDSAGNPIKIVASNQSQALGIYTYLADNPDNWDPIFYNAMQDALAGSIVMPLTGKVALADAMLKKANNTILQARAQDGNEGLTVYNVIPDWIRVRGLVYGTSQMGGFSEPWGPLFSLPTVM